jgi:hypothetical protein
MNTYKVWYAKEPTFREAKFRMDLKMFLKYTHAPVRQVEAENLDQVYHVQQAEVWSPNGEARDLIRGLGLQHTSMSVGDIIEDVTNNAYYEVASIGFKRFY